MRLPSLSIEQSSQANDFFKNSFKQLSDVQQKQVGLIVGGCAADFYAGRKLHASSITNADGTTPSEAEEGTYFDLIKNEEATADGPLLHHSFSYELQAMLLQAMGSCAGSSDLRAENAGERWVAAASALPRSFLHWHGSLLHSVNVLAVLPAMYPWASDNDLQAFVEPYAAMLADPEPLAGLAEAAHLAGECRGVRDCAVSALGVVQRFLQTNPDAVRNSAFRALPGTGIAFPADVALFVPPASGPWPQAAFNPAHAGRQNVALQLHAKLLAEALDVCRSAKSFRHGVDGILGVASSPSAVTRPQLFTGPRVASSARNRRAQAMFVGAALGAKFGIRSVPSEWFVASNDHAAVASLAIGVAQTSWNPGR